MLRQHTTVCLQMCNNWLFRGKKKKKNLNFEKSALKGNESHANPFHVNNPMTDHKLLMTSFSVELETVNPYGLVPTSPAIPLAL